MPASYHLTPLRTWTRSKVVVEALSSRQRKGAWHPFCLQGQSGTPLLGQKSEGEFLKLLDVYFLKHLLLDWWRWGHRAQRITCKNIEPKVGRGWQQALSLLGSHAWVTCLKPGHLFPLSTSVHPEGWSDSQEGGIRIHGALEPHTAAGTQFFPHFFRQGPLCSPGRNGTHAGLEFITAKDGHELLIALSGPPSARITGVSHPCR